MHRIDGFERKAIEVIVPKNEGPKRVHEVTVHRTTQMALADPVERDGLLVTGAARTVIDVAAVVGPRRFEWLIDAVVRQELCAWTDLYSLLQCHSIQGRNGCGPLRRILEARNPEASVPDSAFNRMVGQLLAARGLPTPSFEYEVKDSRGAFLARVDLAYPRQRVAIELDSKRWHMNSGSFVKDPRRRNALVVNGWTVLSFTWADYAERPTQVVNVIRDSLAVSKNQIL